MHTLRQARRGGGDPASGLPRGADYRAPEKTARFPMERYREYSRFTGGGLYRRGMGGSGKGRSRV